MDWLARQFDERRVSGFRPSSSSPPLTEGSQATQLPPVHNHAIRDVIDTVIINVYLQTSKINHPIKSYAYFTVVQKGYFILSS